MPIAANVPLGTSDGTQTGNLSEAVVAGILWDLADSTNGGESQDTVAKPNAVFAAMRQLSNSTPADRGVAGADLVNFLDAWFCLGNDSRGSSTNGVEGITLGIHQFPYDFATISACN